MYIIKKIHKPKQREKNYRKNEKWKFGDTITKPSYMFPYRHIDVNWIKESKGEKPKGEKEWSFFMCKKKNFSFFMYSCMIQFLIYLIFIYLNIKGFIKFNFQLIFIRLSNKVIIKTKFT